MKELILTGILAFSLPLSGCTGEAGQRQALEAKEIGTVQEEYLTTENTVGDVVSHPAFAGFGQFILPLEWGYDAGMTLAEIPSLLPYHSHIDPQQAVDTINGMADMAIDGKLAYYGIYAEEEKSANREKENAGIFFFRGEPDAPFAVICPGGGFSYVGSIHEGFPYAMELNKKGYNAFVIQYRTGGAQQACEDLAAGLSYIFRNAEELRVDTEGYSLWGGSAGARMAAYLGSYGAAAFGGDSLPKPAAVIMQYTGHTDYTENEPPTFVAVGENDGIANWRTMERRTGTLAAMGIETEFHKYPNLGHGFGLGIGTSAEGWLELAIDFWERQVANQY